MKGSAALPQELSFEQKLLSEHRRKSKSQERGSGSAAAAARQQQQKGQQQQQLLEKQVSLEEKIITAAYDKWITVNDAEAFNGETIHSYLLMRTHIHLYIYN
jgi:hypothetical protein